ncbi:MAG: ABC transporter ATP-binding protein [Clostridiales bacterium]|nr:ABC transporter ATP-binding protein [Clostridiales bacterium]
MADPQVLLSLRGLKKTFDTQEALAGLDLDVYAGEFITLLGPSGCGKTTTLRIIAGLELPTQGSVFLDGEDITYLAPEKRAVNTVFQNYALFPHMNVYKNIAYGLSLKGVGRQEIARRVGEMLELVQLSGYEKRLPSQLSGGQRQRVAIARSLILSPRVLLLDEPLGALDLQLRRAMQHELKDMQQQLGITFIYITHDQEEALTMSDRIALMREGRFVQLDTPRGLYEQPRTAFAASFIGETNLINARAEAVKEDGVLLDIAGFHVPCASEDWLTPGEPLLLSLRAQRLHLSREPVSTPCRLSGTLVESHYAGGERASLVRLDDGQVLHTRASTEGEDLPEIGSQVYVWWQQESGVLVRDDREDVHA